MSFILRITVILCLVLTALTVFVLAVIAPQVRGNGREIAFLQLGAGDVQIRLYDHVTGLTFTLPDLNLSPSSLDWSPDGVYLVVTNGYSGREIVTINRDTLTTQRLAAYGERDQYPVWSPDGDQIAFLSSPDNDPFFRPQIYIMDADGTNARRLLTGNGVEISPTWSPDSDQLAFITTREPATGIFTYDFQTENLNRLSDNSLSSFQTISWSPGGQYIAFIGRFGVAHANIFVLDVNTGTMTKLTSGSFSDDYLGWSPDGEWITFTSNRHSGTSHQSLFVIRPDGSGLRQVSPRLDNIAAPVWRP
jgi:TolB protein